MNCSYKPVAWACRHAGVRAVKLKQLNTFAFVSSKKDTRMQE